jgi:hypothetical protein
MFRGFSSGSVKAMSLSIERDGPRDVEDRSRLVTAAYAAMVAFGTLSLVAVASDLLVQVGVLPKESIGLEMLLVAVVGLPWVVAAVGASALSLVLVVLGPGVHRRRIAISYGAVLACYWFYNDIGRTPTETDIGLLIGSAVVTGLSIMGLRPSVRP